MEKHMSTGHRGCTTECPYYNQLAGDRVRVETPESFLAKQKERQKPPPTTPIPNIQTPNDNQDHPEDHHTDLGEGQPPFHSTQGAYHQVQLLVAAHCKQLSSGLTDIFKTEVEREVKQRVSEVIVSEATTYCEQLRLKDEALRAAETRCKDLQEQLELSDQTCSQLQERVRQLEATEVELRNALNERVEVVRSFHQKSCSPLTYFPCSCRQELFHLH